ncbi:hypothetical protein ACA910_008965 [Epithemia clementina (nom. ined.)]
MMSNTAHYTSQVLNPEEVGHEVPTSQEEEEEVDSGTRYDQYHHHHHNHPANDNNDNHHQDNDADNNSDNHHHNQNSKETEETVPHTPNNPARNNSNSSVATLSSPWQYDFMVKHCSGCRCEFNPLNRRHHCRLCGKIFCHNCSSQRALVPPSSIVLIPRGGKKAKPIQDQASFSPDNDPDRMLTYLSGGDANELLYGKGLEERFKLAREPLRVCKPCFQQLAPLQEDLRASNSNAMRFNHIDPTDARRLFNSPIAHTLGHEIRKAAYTLNNLLPQPRRMGALVSSSAFSTMNAGDLSELARCKEECSAISPNFGDWDGVRIPARLVEEAKGIAVMTVIKGGLGLAGFEFGTGLVVARTGEGGRWSAPSAIGTAGISWGALIGAQVSDHVFLLMNDAAVHMLFSNKGSVQLGADVGIAVGPLGRAVEGNLGASVGNAVAPIYTYSLSKGLYAGISLDGKVICTRNYVNEKFYGRPVSGPEILAGAVPLPPAAQPLYEALARCHVYAAQQQQQRQQQQQQQLHNHQFDNGINGLHRIQQQHSYYQQQQAQQRQHQQFHQQMFAPEYAGLLSDAESQATNQEYGEFNNHNDHDNDNHAYNNTVESTPFPNHVVVPQHQSNDTATMASNNGASTEQTGNTDHYNIGHENTYGNGADGPLVMVPPQEEEESHSQTKAPSESVDTPLPGADPFVGTMSEITVNPEY